MFISHGQHSVCIIVTGIVYLYGWICWEQFREFLQTGLKVNCNHFLKLLLLVYFLCFSSFLETTFRLVLYFFLKCCPSFLFHCSNLSMFLLELSVPDTIISYEMRSVSDLKTTHFCTFLKKKYLENGNHIT